MACARTDADLLLEIVAKMVSRVVNKSYLPIIRQSDSR